MICFDKNKYKHKIKNEKNIPKPPAVGTGN
jgi:hypothetical protein